MMYVIAVTPAFHGHGHASIDRHDTESESVIAIGRYGDLGPGGVFIPAGPGIDKYRTTINLDHWTVFQERTNGRGRPPTKAASEFDHSDVKDFLENGPAVLIRVEEIRELRRLAAEEAAEEARAVVAQAQAAAKAAEAAQAAAT